MGHLIFLLLHFGVFLFATPWLILTVPLHLIFAAVSNKSKNESVNRFSHIRCPECRELVRKDARLCRHCHTELIPSD